MSRGKIGSSTIAGSETSSMTTDSSASTRANTENKAIRQDGHPMLSNEQAWYQLYRETSSLPSDEDTLPLKWKICYKDIKAQSPNAANLLKLWSYFDSDDLWYELLKDGKSQKEPWHEYVAESESNFDETMKVLYEYHLVHANTGRSTLESQGYKLDAWVHEQVRQDLDQSRHEAIGRTAMDCIASHVPLQGKPQYWLLQHRLLAHADRLLYLRNGATIQDTDSYTLYCLAELYAGVGKSAIAETLYKTALDGFDGALGQEHILTLHAANNLALVYTHQNKLTDAEAMFLQALKGKENKFGPEHASTLNTVGNLGNLYRLRGDLGNAEAMYQRALKGFQSSSVSGYMSTLNTIANLGDVYGLQGNFQNAEINYQTALKGYREALGASASTYIPCMNTLQNYAAICKETGRLLVAALFYEQALSGIEARFGRDSEAFLKTFEAAKKIRGKLSRSRR